jgi:hypothetical protein
MIMDFMKNVLIIVNIVMVQEMKKIIIAKNVLKIIYLLVILYIKQIVIKNVNTIIILMSLMNISVQKMKHAL